MRRFISVILVVVSFLTFVSCNEKIKDYTGTPIVNLSYETVNYFGGYTQTYILDFENNVVKARGCFREEKESTDFDIIANFSDEEETRLINKLYTYGLFDIEEKYELDAIDGGGWDLVVEYNDGTTKKSSGSNDQPKLVFENCAKAFYDICERGIVAYVPPEYYSPPNNISYTFHNNFGTYTSYGVCVDYNWKGFESSNNSVYEVNQAAKFFKEFYADDKYTLMLSGKDCKFKKCVVTTYDYNEELTNETVVYSGGWFKQKEIEFQLNKIYLVRVEFKNGDFAEYTFNTNTTPKE